MDPAWIFIIIGSMLQVDGACLTLLGFLSRSWPRTPGNLEFIMVDRKASGMGKSPAAVLATIVIASHTQAAVIVNDATFIDRLK